MSSRGKVLHVLDHSVPSADGYAYRSGEILRFQRRAGWNTVQITSSKQGPRPASLERFEGLEFHRTPPAAGFRARLPVLDQWAVVTTLRGRLTSLVAQERPDVVHAHSPALTGLAAAPVARRFGIPFVYEVRAFWEDAAVDQGRCREGDLRYRATRALESVVLRRAGAVTCICAGLRDALAARGVPSERLFVIPNSVDLSRFRPRLERDEEAAGRYGLAPGKTVGFIGSFFRFEGLDLLVEAAAHMRDRDPAVRFLLVGDGEQMAALEALVARHGLGDRVLFTGRVPHTEVERLYGLIDVLVYPRRSARITELVTPLKPLEAMAQGRLVLASDVGGHRELIEHDRTGVLFRAGDVEDLARRLEWLLGTPSAWSRLRDAALDYVSRERDWKTTVNRYADVYARALGRAGRTR